MPAAITSTNPQIAPTNGRVNKVSATIEAPATPTITTHLNTASSEIFIYLISCQRTAEIIIPLQTF
jgi:hypothetical protein